MKTQEYVYKIMLRKKRKTPRITSEVKQYKTAQVNKGLKK